MYRLVITHAQTSW